MKLLLFVFSLVLLAGSVHAQSTVRWQYGAENSDSMFINGMETKLIDAGGLIVSATLIERKGWIPHAFVGIENAGKDRITVDPADWTLTAVGDKSRILKSKDPDKLANSLDNRGAWSAALSAAGGAMATKQTTATIRNSDGTTSTATITEKDEAARARAEATGRRSRDTLASAAQYVRTSSLRVNTVLPGSVVYGIVWFEDKGYKEAVLTVNIGPMIYEFPFSKKKMTDVVESSLITCSL